jgi:hypothetical protein
MHYLLSNLEQVKKCYCATGWPWSVSVLPLLIVISQLKQHMKIKFLFKLGKSAAETLYKSECSL